jgi:septal ring factor EnvC (AmiA/AmiB activator)
MNWLEKLIDPATWKTVLEQYWEKPQLLVPLVLIGLVVWGLRTLIDKNRIEGLQDTNKHLEGELGRTREDRSAIKEELRLAKEEQERVTNELVSLRDENAKQASEIRALQATAPQSQQEQLTVLYKGTSAISVHINAISQANTVVGSTLSTITHRLEATDLTLGSPTFTEPTLTPRSE